MKTAEDWADYMVTQIPTRNSVVHSVKQIQLDAMKEGMRRAADMAWKYTVRVNIEAILSAAEQLTEKDL